MCIGEYEFEKWCAIHVSVGGVGGAFLWIACYLGWRGFSASVRGVLG